MSKTEMHLAMTGSMETSTDPESSEILVWETKMATYLIRQIVLMARSLVHQESCHWVVPKETNRNNQEFEIVAKES